MSTETTKPKPFANCKPRSEWKLPPKQKLWYERCGYTYISNSMAAKRAMRHLSNESSSATERNTK